MIYHKLVSLPLPYAHFFEAIDVLVAGNHGFPSNILGVHRGWMTTYRPDVDVVGVVFKNGDRIKLHELDPIRFPGVRVASVPEGKANLRYLLELSNGKQIPDPYAPNLYHEFITEYDLHLFTEGTHRKIYEKLGAHPLNVDGYEGYRMSVWAPNAKRVSVVGDFNQWDGRVYPMNDVGRGVWELFVPGVKEGALYKFEIKTHADAIIRKADPYANASEIPEDAASITTRLDAHTWQDQDWIDQRRYTDYRKTPMSTYEVHLGSWKRDGQNQPLTYRELADQLVTYLKDMAFTHVELMPVTEHPFDGSWGYQVTGYFAPTSRYGTPEDFMYFVDTLHQADIGVIMDWVPAHFPKDLHGLFRFDGSALYEHEDPRQGEHPDWGTNIFNYGRKEVSNFLIGSALYWLEKYHIDGLRVDAVASMLYLDYGKDDGNWVANQYGGNYNLDAIEFIKHLNHIVRNDFPGVVMIAEESTSFPGVTHVDQGNALAFHGKWAMGWMNDTLKLMEMDPLFRKNNLSYLTQYATYAQAEAYTLPISHDEVVHGKGSTVNKMPGDDWRKMAQARLLYGLQWTMPGKKLLFMGQEFGQLQEWSENRSIDWHLLNNWMNGSNPHRGLQGWVKDLNHLYRENQAMYELDFELKEKDYSRIGFEWVNHDVDNSVVAYLRIAKQWPNYLLIMANLTPIPRMDYRIGVPTNGLFRELLNSDSAYYGGSNVGNAGLILADNQSEHRHAFSLKVNVPPFGLLVFKPENC